jgi:hypothetical protein
MKYPLISWEIGWLVGGGGRYSTLPQPFLQKTSRQIFKDKVNGFSSISDIFFMLISPRLASVFFIERQLLLLVSFSS